MSRSIRSISPITRDRILAILLSHKPLKQYKIPNSTVSCFYISYSHHRDQVALSDMIITDASGKTYMYYDERSVCWLYGGRDHNHPLHEESRYQDLTLVRMSNLKMVPNNKSHGIQIKDASKTCEFCFYPIPGTHGLTNLNIQLMAYLKSRIHQLHSME